MVEVLILLYFNLNNLICLYNLIILIILEKTAKFLKSKNDIICRTSAIFHTIMTE